MHRRSMGQRGREGRGILICGLFQKGRVLAQDGNGTLPRLRLRAMSFCSPIWWEVDCNTILGNGSMCVIATPQAVFGVTANHVLSIYEGHKAQHADLFCQLGDVPFAPVRNVMTRSEHWDLATFKIPAFTLRHWNHEVYKTEAWLPRTVKSDAPIIFGGYPVNRRTQAEGEHPSTMSADFVSFFTHVDSWSENHMALYLDSANWYWLQGGELPPNPELSGTSGGPCFLMVPEENRIELVGFIYEANTEYEVIRVRQANLIDANGLIAAKG